MKICTLILTFTLLKECGALSFMSVIGYSGRRVNITWRYIKKNSGQEKYLCQFQRQDEGRPKQCSDLIRTNKNNQWVQNERFSLYDNTAASVLTVTITDLNKADSGTYRLAKSKENFTEVMLTVTDGSSVIIAVSVVLILIITVLLLMILHYLKQRRAQGPDSDCKMSHSETGNNESVPSVVHDYEEINDIRHLTDSESGTITDCNTPHATPLPTIPSDAPHTVYTAAQLPTIPSDAPHATPLPTIPSDAPHTVYTAAQLPTIPSDAPHTVYTAAQLPNGDEFLSSRSLHYSHH